MTEGATAPLAADLAAAQLAEQLNGADSDDVKALGYLAVDVAGVAAIFAGHSGFNAFWPVYMAGFGIAAVALMLGLRSGRYPTGPNPVGVYFDDSETPYLDAIIALDLARAGVQKLREGMRRRLYRFSVTMTILTTLGTAAALWQVH